jgi:hypothetical protein
VASVLGDVSEEMRAGYAQGNVVVLEALKEHAQSS